jgi:hypothetical protein
MVKEENKKQEESKIMEDKVRKKEISKENKMLSKILIVIGIFFLIIIIAFIIIRVSTKPNYNGVTFNAIQEGEIIFYQTTFKVLYKGELTNYNIYLRNNPNKLKKEVPFDGELNLKNILVLNTTTENLFCEGDWNLAIGNLQNLGIFNIQIMKDENATCSQEGDFMFLQIEEGEESRIEQYGPSCYKLIVSDCEILPVTERFMIETFAKVNEELDK